MRSSRKSSKARLVSASANRSTAISRASVKHAIACGDRSNEHRIRQAVRGVKDMLRRDGLVIPAAA
jgi:hypothetical protein